MTQIILTRSSFTICAVYIFVYTLTAVDAVQAQPPITNTPIPVSIPTQAPTSTPLPAGGVPVEVSPSPTFTPTESLPNVTMVSVAAPGTALVRDAPENGSVIGTLSDDLTYQVTGQYFSWIEFQFGNSPTGRAWVYIDNVSLAGDLNSIPFADPNAQVAQQSPADIATATALVFFQTPGVAETATAQARVLEAPTESNEPVTGNSEFQPTYTPPADIVQLRPTTSNDESLSVETANTVVDDTLSSIAQGDIPPVLPIIALGIVGLLGLGIGMLRR